MANASSAVMPQFFKSADRENRGRRQLHVPDMGVTDPGANAPEAFDWTHLQIGANVCFGLDSAVHLSGGTVCFPPRSSRKWRRSSLRIRADFVAEVG